MFQSLMDQTFGSVRDDDDQEFHCIFMDDVCIATEGYDGDDDDTVVDRHIRHCELFLEAAKSRRIQFKLSKCKWAQTETQLLGFRVGQGLRKCDPAKVQGLREWPAPRTVDDLISFRAYANYIKEYIPGYHEYEVKLKPYCKKGALIEQFEQDQGAVQAFHDLKSALVESAALHSPVWSNLSVCPFELYVDASDFSWGCTLGQRPSPKQAPRPIAVYSRSFSATESAWSAFERELYALREALAAVHHLTKGFTIHVYMDHKNNLFTNSLLSNRRVNKKLLRWALDIEELGDRVHRHWIAGKDNVLGDGPSRNPKDRDSVQKLPVPDGPVKRIIEKMFRDPDGLDQELELFLSSPPREPTPLQSNPITPSAVHSESYVSEICSSSVSQGDTLANAGSLSAPSAAAQSTNPNTDTQDRAAQPSCRSSGALGEQELTVAQTASDDDLEPTSANVADDADSLNLSTSSGVLSSLLDERETQDSIMAVCFRRSNLDGGFPRFPFVAFLPVGGDPEFDHRLPISPSELPRKISHIRGEAQEYYVVEYLEDQVCRDGRSRRRVYYRCDPSGIEREGEEYRAARKRAKAKAWKHVEEAVAHKVDLKDVIPEFGRGPISSGHGFVYHGDGHEGFVFFVHPKDLGPLCTAVWIPHRDTLMPAKEFCKDCEFVRKRSDGIEVWKCNGHDSSELKKPSVSDLPATLREKPLQGLVLVEVFSGDEAKGGCQFSKVFEECGGTALRYDILMDDQADIMQDGVFWHKHLTKPMDVYRFAIPSSSFSPAHTTPQSRTWSRPEGDHSNPQVAHSNNLARYALSLAIGLIQRGTLVMLENPLFSYMWCMPDFKAFLGLKGVHVVRCDYCQHGTPYQRMGLFVSNNPHVVWVARTCDHVGSHPERLSGSHSRQSSPYPRSLCFALCESLVAARQDATNLHVARDALKSSGLGILGNVGDCSSRPQVSADGLFNLSPIGERRLNSVRSGSAVAWYEAESTLGIAHKKASALDAPDAPDVSAISEALRKDPGVEQALKGIASVGYERLELTRLLCLDPDFCDIVIAREVLQQARSYGPEQLFVEIKQKIQQTFKLDKKVSARRASLAVKQAGDYLFDGILFRHVYSDVEQVFGLKAVIPIGGMRSFWYNGRQYRLTLRKTLLLLYHDSEMMGGHSSREDTLSKLRARVWWPSMADDVRKWVKTCSVCKLTKPQRGLTAEQRTQLHDRPFRVLFVDSLGPISPADRGFSWLIHASCPFTGYTWVKATSSDTAETVARLLVEDVFFDICGFPAVLRSDRGTSYTGAVVDAVNNLLGVTQAFGTAFHPESQGHIEGSHKRVNNILAAFASKHPSGWSRWAKLAQWCIRCTPQPNKANKSPYELVTGMIPQGPIDALFAKVGAASVTDPTHYVCAEFERSLAKHSCIGSCWCPGCFRT